MSQGFQMLVDQDVKAGEASDLLARVLHRYRKEGLIMGEASAACVPGNEGYTSGPAIPKVYKLKRSEIPFWKLNTCGHRAPIR